jgi:hypothetical protein
MPLELSGLQVVGLDAYSAFTSAGFFSSSTTIGRPLMNKMMSGRWVCLHMGVTQLSKPFEGFLFQLVFGHADSFLDSFSDALRSAQFIPFFASARLNNPPAFSTDCGVNSSNSRFT